MTTAPAFSIATEATRGQAIVACAGEVDLSNVHLLREPLQAHLHLGRRRLTVDLRQVNYLDSAALGVLLQAAQELREAGERLHILATPRQHRLFMLLGCPTLLTVITASEG